MFRLVLTIALIFLLVGCNGPDATWGRKEAAERYFRGVYGGDSSVVDKLCAEDMAVSYPGFQQLFDTSVIRGRDAVRHFASGFSSRWAGTQVTFHETIAESSTVVLVWSFQGKNVGSTRQDRDPSGKVESWGGITLIHFDSAGKIEAEIGEESSPGPFERMEQR